jgi:hypothetical protein
MKNFAMILIAASLAACGYSTDEYALNRNALAPGAAVTGAPVKGINPVSGELMGGSGTPARSLGNPKFERYDPHRVYRN